MALFEPWSVVAPIAVLQAVFDLGTDRYGMIAGWPCDAMECLKLFHKALGRPNNEDCWFIEEQLHYPSGIPKDARSEISQVLHQIASSKGAILDNSPKTLVLSILPYMLRTDDSDAEQLDGEWVTATFTEWDAAVNLAPFFRSNPPCSEYHVKAVVYHLHPADGPIKTKCGHYVAYVKQAQLWHLANDSSVSAVLMSGLSGVPYVLVLERKDVPGANLVAKQVQQPAAEILVEIPDVVPRFENSTGSESEGFDVSDSQEDDALAELSDGQGDEPLAKRQRPSGKHRSDRRQDRSMRQQDRSDRQQDRSIRQQDRSNRQQDRSTRWQFREWDREDLRRRCTRKAIADCEKEMTWEEPKHCPALEFQRKVRSINCPCVARPWWAGAVWKEDIDDEWKQILTRYTPGMLVHKEDVDEIDRIHLAELDRIHWKSLAEKRWDIQRRYQEYPFRFPDDIPRTRRCCGKPMSPAEMARCGKECRMNATWHPDVIGLPLLFEPYTPSPADTAWYPKELLDEARCARLGIRTISINFPFRTADGQVVLKPLQRDERDVEPWTGRGMWSEWRVPPLFPNHPAFIHPAILQDPTSWDNVMWETEGIHAGAAATIYVNILWKGIFAKAQAEAWHLPYPWELKICSSEGFRTGWPLQLLPDGRYDNIIYLPDGRFQPYSGSPDAFWGSLWEFWWTSWRTQGKMRDHIPEFIQTVAEHTEMTELRRDDPVDLDMPVFPHLYIEYVVGQTIEHYVEQSRVKSPTRTISRRMFSDIAVDIRIAFSIGIQRSRHEPMFTRRQILRLRNVVVEKCNEVTYGIRAVDTIPADDVIFIRPM